MMTAATNETQMSEPSVSASVPDWTREQTKGRAWDPSRALLRSIRDYQRAEGALSGLSRKYAVLRHRLWSMITGADIPINAAIGGGLLLPHPNGVVIHPHARIGCNCLIFQQVTIGATSKGIPTIGGHVDIGAGAKIIGPIHIGDHAQIGANAVVRESVPAHGIFVATPGFLLERQK
jgi:serine O-acetyltransferase